jgi:hypothetical protein
MLTGEPGSRKTLAARWIADRFRLDDGFYQEFQVRSDSRAKDLRYDFDAVGWFRQSQIEQKAADKAKFLQPRALGHAFGWDREPDKPFVVLIDEIDKAPRDFPNDLLLELDQMRFVVEETQRTVGPPQQRPIVVITSNSERRLPDPFLRRCITHNIELGPDTVVEILARRLAGFDAQATLLRTAGQFWTSIDGGGPSTSTKAYISALLAGLPRRAGPALNVMVLTHVDADHITGLLELIVDDSAPAVGDVWFNGGDHLAVAAGIARPAKRNRVGASDGVPPAKVLTVRQGIDFSRAIEARGWPWNAAFQDGPVMTDGTNLPIRVGAAALTLIGPPKTKLASFQRECAQGPSTSHASGRQPDGAGEGDE